MYKTIIIMFCSFYWSLYSMEDNLLLPPGSRSARLVFNNDTNNTLVVTTYIPSIKKLVTNTLSKKSYYPLEIEKNAKNHYLSITELGHPQELRPIMIDMHSSFLNKEKQVREIICVNTDGIFLYYEFLKNPVTINTVISLQRIWAHAEQA